MNQRPQSQQQPEDFLTIEGIAKKFDSQFEMVNHAVRVVENMIHSGRSSRVRISSKNPAAQVLAEIREGKDFLEEIKPIEAQGTQENFHEQKVKGYSSFKTNIQKD